MAKMITKKNAIRVCKAVWKHLEKTTRRTRGKIFTDAIKSEWFISNGYDPEKISCECPLCEAYDKGDANCLPCPLQMRAIEEGKKTKNLACMRVYGFSSYMTHARIVKFNKVIQEL